MKREDFKSVGFGINSCNLIFVKYNFTVTFNNLQPLVYRIIYRHEQKTIMASQSRYCRRDFFFSVAMHCDAIKIFFSSTNGC
jgi:hypothetical protein